MQKFDLFGRPVQQTTPTAPTRPIMPPQGLELAPKGR